MTDRLQVFVVILGLIMFFGIIELVRRRKLKEEYSFIWLITGFFFVLFAVWSDILVIVSQILGIALPVNTLFFMAIIFIFLLCLYFSLRISALSKQVKNLAQQLAMLQSQGNQPGKYNHGRKEQNESWRLQGIRSSGLHAPQLDCVDDHSHCRDRSLLRDHE